MSKTATAVREPAQRAPGREQLPTDEAREAIRKPTNPNEMTWTDPTTGQTWSRNIMSASENVLDFPPELVPAGFTYQWIRESTYQQEDRANLVSRGRNGWRAVPQERHPDRVLRHDGLILMEAPTVFVEAAREEERLRAARERKTSLPGMNLPSGFDGNHRGAQANTFARVGTPVPSDPAQRTPYRRSVDIDS